MLKNLQSTKILYAFSERIDHNMYNVFEENRAKFHISLYAEIIHEISPIFDTSHQYTTYCIQFRFNLLTQSQKEYSKRSYIFCNNNDYSNILFACSLIFYRLLRSDTSLYASMCSFFFWAYNVSRKKENITFAIYLYTM